MHVSDIEELPTDGSKAWLLVQFGADTAEESLGTAREFASWLVKQKGYDEGRILVMPSKQEGGQSQDIWEIREGGLGSTAFARGEDNWPGWEDSAVPPSSLGRYVVELRALMDRHGIKGAMYGHFGQGCIHCRISFDLRTAAGIAELPLVPGGGRRPRRAVRRVGLRRARRRAAAGRVAGEAVRARAAWRRCGSSSGSGTRTGR